MSLHQSVIAKMQPMAIKSRDRLKLLFEHLQHHANRLYNSIKPSPIHTHTDSSIELANLTN
uniref:Uncharacterized protein n=1 Tax=viral metagenome TaxID=1070528 RepID=A0A6C0C0K9_9ZZZZ